MYITRLGRFAVAATALTAVTWTALAQPGPAHRKGCDRIATTSITFGYTGGNLKPQGWRIARSGAVTAIGTRAGMTRGVHALSRDDVRRAAREGWSHAFVSLPTAPTRPTQNPDAARQFIELRSACGSKHVEYADGEGAPAFRDLYARLQALAGVSATAPH